MLILLLWYHQRQQKQCRISLAPMLLSCNILSIYRLSKNFHHCSALFCQYSLYFVDLGLVIKPWSAWEFLKDQTSFKATVLWQLNGPLPVITEEWCGIWQVVFSYKWCAYWIYDRQGCVEWVITFIIFSLILSSTVESAFPSQSICALFQHQFVGLFYQTFFIIVLNIF
jgi:hypothetical protein